MKLGRDADACPVFHEDIHHLHLLQVEILCIFHHLLHIGVVLVLVRLRAERVDRRPLAEIQHAHLDGCRIGCDAHLAAQCIDFLYKMALPRSADRRIAWHHGDIFQRDRGKQRLHPHARCRKCRLAACMACADDDHIIRINEIHGILLSLPRRSSSPALVDCLYSKVLLYKIFSSISKKE